VLMYGWYSLLLVSDGVRYSGFNIVRAAVWLHIIGPYLFGGIAHVICWHGGVQIMHNMVVVRCIFV
jgi:hypothetical protein